MIEYNIVFLYLLSSFKALLYARSSFGAPVMISWRVFGGFQVTPTAIIPHFTNFELVIKGGYLL